MYPKWQFATVCPGLHGLARGDTVLSYREVITYQNPS